jgi:hypothetical protein
MLRTRNATWVTETLAVVMSFNAIRSTITRTTVPMT